jgi:hypothetical protein
MNNIHALTKTMFFFLLVGIATWWVVAPRSYVACIRKVSWLWMSTYPLNTRTWFPQYLRAFGLLLWLGFLGGQYYCYLRR